MSESRDPAAPAGDQARYRAVTSMDPAAPDALPRLLAALDDASWRVRAAAAQGIASLPDPARAIPALVAALAPGVAPGRASAAANALVRLGSGARAALAEALASPAAETRTVAAELLGEIGDRRAAAPLASRLADPEENVRAAAVEALGKLGGPDAIAALRVALATEDPALRRGAIDALSRLHAAPDLARLRALCCDRALRRPALRLAGFSTDPGAAALLLEGLADAGRGVREAALAGLGQQRFRRAPGLAAEAAGVRDLAAREPELVTLAAAVLGSEDAQVKAGAISVLEWARAVEHAPVLARAAEDERVRVIASDALTAFGADLPAALAPVLHELPPGARAAALSALAHAGHRGVIPLLCEDAASQDDAVRASAIEALSALGDPAAADCLAPLLDHRDTAVAAAAATGLERLAAASPRAEEAARAACRRDGPPGAARCRLAGRVGGAQDAPALRRALSEPDPAVRVASAGALAALAARGVLAARPVELLDAVEDLAPEVRAAAGEALGVLARDGAWLEATRALAVALRDEEGAVRAAAARALGAARAADYAPALAELAGDAGAPPDAVAAAVRALAELGAAEVEVLERAARHADPEVVKEAVAAAARVAGGATILLTAAAHPRWDVRRAAAAALGRRGDPALAATARRLGSAEDDPLVAEAFAEAVALLEARR